MLNKESTSQNQEISMLHAGQNSPTASDISNDNAQLSEEDLKRIKKIKDVYERLGEIVDEEKKEMRQREEVDMARIKWYIRAAYTTIIVWLAYFAVRRTPITDMVIIVFGINAIGIVGLFIYNTFRAKKWGRRSAQERFREEGERAAQKLVRTNKKLLRAGGKPVLKEVEVKFKSDGTLEEARFKLVSGFLKNITPGAVALAALFGISNFSEGSYFAGGLLALLGASIVLINVLIEVGFQPHVIEMKECIAMLERAQADSSDLQPPEDNMSSKTDKYMVGNIKHTKI
jgi:hypothetical protein